MRSALGSFAFDFPAEGVGVVKVQSRSKLSVSIRCAGDLSKAVVVLNSAPLYFVRVRTFG